MPWPPFRLYKRLGSVESGVDSNKSSASRRCVSVTYNLQESTFGVRNSSLLQIALLPVLLRNLVVLLHQSNVCLPFLLIPIRQLSPEAY